MFSSYVFDLKWQFSLIDLIFPSQFFLTPKNTVNITKIRFLVRGPTMLNLYPSNTKKLFLLQP